MRILGVDPGLGRVGWGVVMKDGQKVSAIDYACFETAKTQAVPDRLAAIFAFFEHLLKVHQPEALAIEELFFNKNVTTALTVGQARGVILLAAARYGIPMTTYTPPEVKLAVTGYGKADKKQVGQLVKTLLQLPKVPTPDDTADALAIALTHAFSSKTLVKHGKATR